MTFDMFHFQFMLRVGWQRADLPLPVPRSKLVPMNELPTKPAEMSICPQCGAAFVCGLAAGWQRHGEPYCWCFDLPPALPVTAAASCLCPDCLRQAIAERHEPQ